MHNHFNGLKTAGLLGGLFALLLAIGALLASGTGSANWIWIMALIGVATTAYSYWNSDKLAIRACRHPVSEAEQPAMYRIVRELSTGPTSRCPGCTSPHHGAERLRHRAQPEERGGLLHRGHPACWTSANCAACSATN